MGTERTACVCPAAVPDPAGAPVRPLGSLLGLRGRRPLSVTVAVTGLLGRAPGVPARMLTCQPVHGSRCVPVLPAAAQPRRLVVRTRIRKPLGAGAHAPVPVAHSGQRRPVTLAECRGLEPPLRTERFLHGHLSLARGNNSKPKPHLVTTFIERKESTRCGRRPQTYAAAKAACAVRSPFGGGQCVQLWISDCFKRC